MNQNRSLARGYYNFEKPFLLRYARCFAVIVLALLLSLISTAALAGGKVTLCHFPPDNPDNPQTLNVSQDSVDDHLSHGDFLGECPPTAAEIDPPNVRFDPNLFPPVDFIAGIDDGPPRRLVRLNADIGDGYQFDFVENEVYLITDDPADLADFQSRWVSSVLFHYDLPGADPNAPPTIIYLLNVDPSTANTSQLNRDLAAIDPHLHGENQVSSEAGLELLELVASEIGRHGLHVGINVLLQSQDYSTRSTEEAAVGPDLGAGSFSFTYTRDGFAWPYMLHDAAWTGEEPWSLDTGVAEAFRVVQAEGRLGNRVRAMVADGGFFPNEDFPPYTAIGPLRTINPDPTGCGSGTPPQPDSTPPESVCATHGTHTVLTGFGLPDNGFGIFGPGGPVSDLILLQSPSVDFNSIARFITESLPEALALRPQIINMSASVAIPSGWCFIACEPIDEVSGWLHSHGIIFVAAAGNESRNVDATDEICIFGCISFEEATIVPCETDDVLCVGATHFFQNTTTDYSNYGTADGPNSVDIYAPGDVLSVVSFDADETVASPVDDLQVIHGTSFASPFTAGVLALTWAANPALNNDQVTACVLDNGRDGPLPGGRTGINALGAVSCAMNGSAPWVKIAAPAPNTTFTRGAEAVILVANADDYEDGTALTIHWTSSLDGDLGDSAPGGSFNLGPFGLSVGNHHICATVTDSSARDWQDCRDFRVLSAAPVVTVLQPLNNVSFSADATIPFSATVYDPDGSGIADITWFIETKYASAFPKTTVSHSLSGSLDASTLWPDRRYLLVVLVTDDTGAVGRGYAEFDVNAVTTGNAPPVITINAPAPGDSYQYEGSPIVVPLDAVVNDPEDGTIPFDQINWRVRIDGGGEVTLPVTTTTICLVYDPILGHCSRYEIHHSIELLPDGSNTSTRFDIKGYVRDSGGLLNDSGNGQVTVFVTQLI